MDDPPFRRLRMLAKLSRTGVVTERLPDFDHEAIERVGIVIERAIDRRFAASLAIRQVDTGSCNGCGLQIHALNHP